jgi:uncharacterized protein (TIGR03435 family)
MIPSRIAICALAVALPITAQQASTSAPPPTFDVASVKLGADDRVEGRRIQTTPNSLTTRGLTLRACILWAYGMPAKLIAPDWIDDVRLDIVAKTAKPATDKQLYQMMGTLLVERMGLKTHTEKREMAVYALTLAKSGPKFSPSKTEGPETTRMDKGAMLIEHATLSELAAELSGKMFDRPVIDATGLKGNFDVRFDPMAARGRPEGGQNDAMAMMMSALEDQMGLKVVPRKAQVDVLVVDHAERKPKAN